MLTHFWHDSAINQMPHDGEIDKYAIPKGFVNATQMCKANGKFLADYLKLKSTKQYLQALSNDMNIITSLLVIEIQGYGSQQSTWVHPEIAIDIARWVSVDFRIWANRTLMKIFLGQDVVPQQSLTQIQLLVAIAQQMAQQEQRLLEHEQRQHEILYRLKGVEVEQDRFNAPCGHKYSIVGFANLQGLEMNGTKKSSKHYRIRATACATQVYSNSVN
jgi:hypothetical protein